MTNHLYIPITLRIYLTGNSILRWSVRTAIATNKFACRWWPFSILVLLHCGLLFKTTKQPTVEKQNEYLIHTNEADVSRSCAHVLFCWRAQFFLFAVACDFLARLIRVFRLTFSGTVSGDVSPNSRMLLCHPVGWYKADSQFLENNEWLHTKERWIL